MRVHLYALCWNDIHMLPFSFRHYEPWVERFFIFDDGSDDGSLDFLANRVDTQVLPFPRSHPGSLILSAVSLFDQVWKQSRGVADWVVITDLDEHLTHTNMASYLGEQLAAGATAVPALGYQMICDDLPRAGSLLCRDYRMGAPWRQMSKLSIFRPDKIVETNFQPGRHQARPEGDVVFPERDDVINLHYKYLGVAHTHSRHVGARDRLGLEDKANNWGHKYNWSEAELGADFDRMRATLIDVGGVDHHDTHHEPRWWR